MNYLPILLAGTPLLAMAGNSQAQEPEKPNIVVIIADDLGTHELSCYGGQNMKTPNIDRLAKEGVRFTNNYASCAMSVPIRASLYTGLYPSRHGSYQNHKASYPHLKSVTHYLSDLGYKVGRTGKNHPANQKAVYDFEVVNGFTVDCTAEKANYTMDGVEAFIKTDDPFCLFVCSIHPHAPWTWGDPKEFDTDKIIMPPNSLDTPETREVYSTYLAEIRALDDEVGSVLQSLETAGKLNNTLVIFLGEQGPQFPFAKWTCYRYGQNSALIARYPNKIDKEITCEALVQYEDMLPTLIELAGGDAIDDLDGTSFLDALFGEKEEHRQWAYGIHNNIPAGAPYPIRSIQDKRYKLIINLSPEKTVEIKSMMNLEKESSVWRCWVEAAKTNLTAKMLINRFEKRPAIEFYDLESDPWELENLADKAEHKTRITTMQTELERWMEEQGDRGALMDTDNPEDRDLKTPRAITSYDDFSKVMRNDMDGNYYLTNDITIPDGTEWVPIGARDANDGEPAQFRGIFDGRGYTIKNLKITTEGNFKGMFGRLNNAIIKNLELEVDIVGKECVGGLSAATFGETLIEKVAVRGRVKGENHVGGITGRISWNDTRTGYNIIRDCYTNADVDATVNNAGGIFGHTRSANNTFGKIALINVYVAGKISAPYATGQEGNAGGLFAHTDHKYVRIENCAVVCPSITGSTPNYFYSRNIADTDFEKFSNTYVRDDIQLAYIDPNSKGKGGEMDLTDRTRKNEVITTSSFFRNTLNWDFGNIWQMEEGALPEFRDSVEEIILPIKKQLAEKVYQATTLPGGKWKALVMNQTINSLAADVKVNLTKDGMLSVTDSDGDKFSQQAWYLLNPGFDNQVGYSIELKARSLKADEGSAFFVQGFDESGKGFRLGIYNDRVVEATNPLLAPSKLAGNTSDWHTYRIVVGTNRVAYVFCDGQEIGTFPLTDFWHDNLIRNGGFEGGAADNPQTVIGDWRKTSDNYTIGTFERTKQTTTNQGECKPRAGSYFAYLDNQIDNAGSFGHHPRTQPIPIKQHTEYALSFSAHNQRPPADQAWRDLRLWWNESDAAQGLSELVKNLFHKSGLTLKVSEGWIDYGPISFSTKTGNQEPSNSPDFVSEENRKAVVVSLPTGLLKSNKMGIDNLYLTEKIDWEGASENRRSFFQFGKSMGTEPTQFEIEYIAFDLSGAFAPDTSTGSSNPDQNNATVSAYVIDHTLYVENTDSDTVITVYDLSGAIIAQTENPTIKFAQKGVYIVKADNQVLKVCIF